MEAVLPGIQAAFVDIGTEKAGFLHVSDLEMEDDDDENGGGGRRRRDRKYPPIQDHIRKGQEIIVQVTKEPIGTKGPRLTAEISLPGRFLVYMPGSSRVGVSRKIEDREERSRLRKLAKEVLPKDEGGMIVRTVSEELSQNSQRAPLLCGQKKYTSGECAGLLKNMKLKHITVDASNNFKIDLSMDTMYSPLHLMAVMYYALDRLSGGQLSNKAGFEWVKMARMLG